MVKNRLLLIGLILQAALTPHPSSAQFRGVGFHESVNTQSNQAFLGIFNGASGSNKDDIFKRFLSTEGLGFTWPDFPRTWHEQSVTESIVTTTTVGYASSLYAPFGLPILSGAYRGHEHEYRYQLKSALILVLPKSVRKREPGERPNGFPSGGGSSALYPSPSPAPGDQPNQRREIADPDGNLQEMFVWDPVHNRTFPNMAIGVPIVGFCIFEALYSYTDTVGGYSSTATVNTTVHNEPKMNSFSKTMFSNFFQVDGTLSIMQMRDELCARRYRKLVRENVERDLSRVVAEYKANADSQNRCKPNEKYDNNENGDVACINWFEKRYPRGYERAAIPRCVPTQDGGHRCVVRSREGGACPMIWDPKAKRMRAAESVIGAASDFYKATSARKELLCDEKPGLVCRATALPRTILGRPVLMGSAACLKKSIRAQN